MVGLVQVGDAKPGFDPSKGIADLPDKSKTYMKVLLKKAGWKSRASSAVGQREPARIMDRARLGPLVDPRTRSAPFSATMSVTALVFPLTRVGMMEASQTRSPSSPRTFKSESTTA